MGADVLFTDDNSDLNFRARVEDSDDNLDLAGQHMQSSLEIWEGDWFIDATWGVDWLGYLTQKRVNTVALGQEIRRALLDVPQVTNIRKVEFSQSGRIYTVNVEGNYGSTTFRGQLLLDTEATDETFGDNAIMALFYPVHGMRPIRH